MGWLAVGLWTLGLALAGDPDEAPPGPDVVSRAVSIIEDRMGSKVDPARLYQAAAHEIASELDQLVGSRGNAVLTEEQVVLAEQWREGTREGIGVEFLLMPGQGLLLSEIIEGSPGAQAGLQPGDLVVGIDGDTFLGLEPGEVLECIYSADKSMRVVDIRRGTELLRVEVLSGKYKIHNLHRRAHLASVVVELDFFGRGVSEELFAVLQTLLAQETLVLDLRDNQGGILEEAVQSAGFFLEPGSVILQTVSRDGQVRMVQDAGPRSWKGDLVLLVNQGTGGPAEAFVGALQAHQVGTVVGTRTAGNAGLPSFHELGSGLVMQLTDEIMRGPMGDEWSGKGLLPDVVVEPVDFVLGPRLGMAPPDLQRDAAIQLISSD